MVIAMVQKQGKDLFPTSLAGPAETVGQVGHLPFWWSIQEMTCAILSIRDSELG